MRRSIVFSLVLGSLALVQPLWADCQNGPVFPDTIYASDKSTFTWLTPSDVDFLKGDVANLAAYTIWARGTLTNANTLDTSLDDPGPGQAIFVLVKLTGPPCGSWQTALGAQPGRDIEIEPGCTQVAPTDQEIEDAVAAALAVAPNPWSIPDDAQLFNQLVQEALGCSFELLEVPGATSTEAESTPPQWNRFAFFCGLDNEELWALELPAGPCLNLACFMHDSCYYANCAGGPCPFSPQTDSVLCDDPLVVNACDPGPSGCLQEDGLGWYFSNKAICAIAEFLTIAQSINPLCQDPPCSGANEVCPPAGGEECCTLIGPDDATCNGVDDDCDSQTDEDYVLVPTTCGVGACGSTGTTSCAAGVVQDSCIPGAPGVEVCDGIDNDCNGVVDEGLNCLCPVSVWKGDGDANDAVDNNHGVLQGVGFATAVNAQGTSVARHI